MIPKKIHYCWFGGAPLPKAVTKCIESWKKKSPDYEIIRWDETNFPLEENSYEKQAFDEKKWAFVTDVARLKIVYEHGGIYLDTDVELLKSLDELTKDCEAFFSFESESLVATGLGFGAAPGHSLVKKLIDQYEGVSFIKEDGSYDLRPCPERNTEVFLEEGLVQNGNTQKIGDTNIYACEIMCPINYVTMKKKVTKNTVSIHHYDSSWCNDVTKRSTRLKRIIGIRAYCWLYAKFLCKSDKWEW